MCDGEKKITKTGRMRKATFAQVCEWVRKAWEKLKTKTIVNGFIKAGLLPCDDPPSTSLSAEAADACAESSENDTSGNDSDTRKLDAAIMQLFISESEGSDFDGFHTLNIKSRWLTLIL